MWTIFLTKLREKINMFMRGLIALAFGTLGLGIAEFVAVGLLPYIAKDFGISIGQAGMMVSTYAVGVAIGAFSLLWLRKLKLKTILLLLVVVMILGNAYTAISPTFNNMLVGRFVAGLPHGCFFGVGSIIAQRIATQGKGNNAVAIMVAGMTVANVFGVPLGTAIAHSFSWRAIFCIIALWDVLVLISAALWVKDTGGIDDHGFFAQFRFLKHPAPWLVVIATLCGNAGIFSVFSYASPVLTGLSNLSLELIPVVLIASGISMVIFNLVSGHLCDKFTPGKIATIFQCMTIVALLTLAVFGSNIVVGITVIVLIAGFMFAISTPEQVAILRCAPGGLLLGAAMIQAAFNLGNALGAVTGGIPFRFDLPINFSGVLGAVLAACGAALLFMYYKFHEHKFSENIESDRTLPGNEDYVAQDTQETK